MMTIFHKMPGMRFWLSGVGKHGWVVLTKDKHIRYRAGEIQALRMAGLRTFVLASRGDLTGAEVGAIFLKALPAIQHTCDAITPPFIALVEQCGKVRVVDSEKGKAK